MSDFYALCYYTSEVMRISVFFFKQKTAYEMRISDWSSDVCSSDLRRLPDHLAGRYPVSACRHAQQHQCAGPCHGADRHADPPQPEEPRQQQRQHRPARVEGRAVDDRRARMLQLGNRSEEHTSELQSLMRISYAVFCLKKKTPNSPH